MNSLNKLLVYLFFMFTAVATAWAGDELRNLQYITEEYRPYNYVEKNELKGFSVELLNMVWRELKTEPRKIEVYPWARAYHLLQTRKNIVLFTTVRTEERAGQFKWAGPIKTAEKSVLIALKNRKLKLHSIEDAKRYRIGAIRKDAAEQILLSMGFTPERIESVSYFSQNIRKLKAGRIDLISFNEQSFSQEIKKHGFRGDDYETVLIVSVVDPCYAFSKKIPDHVVQQFQSALDAIRQGDGYHLLLKKYFP